MIGFRARRTIKLGAKSLWLHKLRSGLTALGIVFGVASVVAMLAIGEGASYEAQEQIKKLGRDNIIVSSVKPPGEKASSTQGNTLKEYGLTYDDIERIKTTIPGVEVVVPVREIKVEAKYRQRKTDALLLGTVPWFLDVRRLPLMAGRFLTTTDMKQYKSSAVVDTQAAEDLFQYENPIGKYIKINSACYHVVGIVDDSIMSSGAGTASSRRVFIPITTARSRFGEMTYARTSSGREFEKVQLHQATVKVLREGQVVQTAEAVRTLLERFHEKPDFEITVPLELLKQAEHTKKIFNAVLGSIAGISLLVGGIGIMNIMLASITERTREIGIRRALGAKKRDIILQFLAETVLLSGSGGLLGVALGVTLPLVVSSFTKMKTIVTPWSLILAFSISAAVGIIFGLYPARRAAELDPIEALRHE